jgi:hypothetical protein
MQERFPEFEGYDDDRVQLFLDDAALLMSDPTRWLDFYDIAQMYLAAHLLTVASGTEAGDSGPAYPLKRQEVDDVVIENAVTNISATIDDLFSTSYGKQYVRYRRIAFAGIYGV